MATNEIGVRVKLEGEKQYQEQMRQITQQTKLMKAETQSMESAWGKSTSAMDKARQQTDLLNRQIAQQKETVATAEANVKKYSEATGENSSQTLKWKATLAEAQNELHRLQNELANVPNKLQIMGTRMQEVGSKIQNVGKSITSVGSTLTKSITVPLTALGTAAVKVTADFDKSMSKVAALSGATGKDFDTLRNKAREMGATTQYSAKESADALSYMALAGWNTQQMTDGLDGVLNLAAASQMDLATASDLVTDYLSAFGLEAKDSAKMADELAYAQANSNTTTQQLGDAFGNSAAQMHTAGQTMETTTAILEAFANQGLKGSEAGTALSAMVRDITQKMKNGKIYIGQTAVTVQDANGNFRDMTDILADVEAATDGMGTAEKSAALMTTFTARSVKGVSMALTEGTGNIKTYRDELNSASGAAKEMAETMQDNLSGELTKLKSEVQELGISFGDILVPHIRKAVEWVQEQVDKFNSLDDSTKEMIVKIGLFAAAVGPALTVVGKLTTGVGSLLSGVGKGVEAIGKFSKAHTALAAAAGPVGLALTAAAAAAIALKKGYDYIKESARKANPEMYDTVDALKDVTKEMKDSGSDIKSAMADAESSIGQVLKTAETGNAAIDTIERFGTTGRKTADEMAVMKGAVAELNGLYPNLNLQIDESTGKLNMSTQEVREYIQATSEMMKVEAYHKAVAAVTEEVTQAYADQMRAAYDLDKAQAQLAAAQEAQTGVIEANKNAYAGMSDAERELMELGTQNTGVYNNQGVAIKDLEKAVTEAQTAYDATNVTIQDGTEYLEYLKNEMGLTDEQINAVTESTTAESEALGEAGVAVDEFGNEIVETETYLDEFGNSVDAATGEIVEYADQATEAYTKAYEAAKTTIEGQIGLFDEMSIEAGHSVDEIQNAMTSQANSYNQMAADMEIAWNYAVQTGDTSTQNLIKQISDLGVQGAGDMHNLAQAIQNEDYDIVNSMSNMTTQVSDAKDRYARILAQAQSGTVTTSNGIISTYDYAGQQIVANVQQTGSNMSSEWSGDLRDMRYQTVNGMDEVANQIYYGMKSATGSVSSEASPMENAAFNTFGRVEAAARLTSLNLGTSGQTAMSMYQNGIWAGSNGVFSAADYVGKTAYSYVNAYSSWAHSSGLSLGYNFAQGIYDSAWNVAAAANYVASIAAAYLHHSTPEKGPLRDDDVWGEHMGENFAEGVVRSMPTVEAAASALAQTAADAANDYTYSMPVNGAETISQSIDSLAGSGMTGDDITINVYASEGMNINQLADRIQDRLALVQRQRAAAYA